MNGDFNLIHHQSQAESLFETVVGSLFSFIVTFIIALYVYDMGFNEQFKLSILFLCVSICCRYTTRRFFDGSNK
jgi:ABC-type antimicrobial peptide transport system permease subunit